MCVCVCVFVYLCVLHCAKIMLPGFSAFRFVSARVAMLMLVCLAIHKTHICDFGFTSFSLKQEWLPVYSPQEVRRRHSSGADFLSYVSLPVSMASNPRLHA